MSNRIVYLDGLRGIAILLVIGFHEFSRWSAVYPYGDSYSSVALFEMGWLGVNLFFIISGFVILMTLENTASIGSFVYRRWLRLFPAMLIAILVIYLTMPFIPERPAGSPGFLSALPGITFIEPGWWVRAIGVDIPILEDAFWSLYVEFKFYVIAAILFYFLGRKILISSLIFFYLLSLASQFWVSGIDSQWAHYYSMLVYELSFEYFGWFAAGALFYLHVTTGQWRPFGRGHS